MAGLNGIRRPVEVKADNRDKLLLMLLRDDDSYRFLILNNLHFAAAQQLGLKDFGFDGREDQPVSIPVEDMQVNRVSFAGAGSPPSGHEGAASCPVNAFAELFQPCPYFPQPFRLPFLNLAFGGWTDVEKQVAITASTTHKEAKAFP